ncbi:MAG: TIGR04211 family SH3 domain-containing protein [Pseudomonadales bacterium]
MKSIKILSLLLIAALPLLANSTLAEETRWVTDELTVTMRTGKSNEHRIRNMIKSGTELTILEHDKESGYSHIKTARGSEGWILTRQLSKTPPARIRLAEAQVTIKRLTDTSTPIQQKAAELELDNANLQQALDQANLQLQHSNTELKHIQSLSVDVIAIDDQNKLLMERSQLLEHESDVLKAENERLSNDSRMDWFFNGVLAVGFGVLLALLIPKLSPRRKHTEWR